MDFMQTAHAAQAAIEDAGVIKTMFDWAWAGVLTLVGIVYKSMKDDFGQHRKEDRENFISLFEGQEEINKSIGEGFRELDKTIGGMHVELLKQINEKADR